VRDPRGSGAKQRHPETRQEATAGRWCEKLAHDLVEPFGVHDDSFAEKDRSVMCADLL
jgi:hypothetical protein